MRDNGLKMKTAEGMHQYANTMVGGFGMESPNGLNRSQDLENDLHLQLET